MLTFALQVPHPDPPLRPQHQAAHPDVSFTLTLPARPAPESLRIRDGKKDGGHMGASQLSWTEIPALWSSSGKGKRSRNCMAVLMLGYSGFYTAQFGGAAVVAVLFFASGIPRVQSDVLSVSRPLFRLRSEHLLTRFHQWIPIVGPLTKKPELPASDNVSLTFLHPVASSWADTACSPSKRLAAYVCFVAVGACLAPF